MSVDDFFLLQISLRLQTGGKNIPELKAREVLFTTTNEQRSSDVHKWWQNTIVSLRRRPPPLPPKKVPDISWLSKQISKLELVCYLRANRGNDVEKNKIIFLKNWLSSEKWDT